MFLDQCWQPFPAEDGQRAGQAAAGFQRAVVGVIGSQRGVCANLVRDVCEKSALLGGERFAGGGFLLGEPVLETLPREFGKRRKFRLLAGGKADEGNEIGERVAGFEGFHPVAVRPRVAFPNFGRGEVIVVAFHGGGEFADVGY